MVTCDGAGASHELVKELDRLASRHGYQVNYSGLAGADHEIRRARLSRFRPISDSARLSRLLRWRHDHEGFTSREDFTHLSNGNLTSGVKPS
jgi:hypothetical protein